MSIYSEKKIGYKKKIEKSGIWEDKLGRNTNQPKICQKNCIIHKVTQTDQPIEVHNFWLIFYAFLAISKFLRLIEIGAWTVILVQQLPKMYSTRTKVIK